MESVSDNYMQFVLSLLLVLLLLYAVLWAIKKFGLAQNSFKSSGKRLKIIEVLPLDHKRKIALVQKDTQEFTLFIGESSDIVLDQAMSPSANKSDSLTRKKTVKSKTS